MDERRDRQTDRQTDGDDFTGPCPTNVELPKPLAVTKNLTSNVSHNVEVTSIKRHLHVANSSRIDQISAKSIKDSAPLIAIHLADIIYLSIKLVFFLRNRI